MPLAVVLSLAGAVAGLRIEGAVRWLFAAALAGCLLAVLVVSGPGLVATWWSLRWWRCCPSAQHRCPPAVRQLIGTWLTAAFPVVAGVTGGDAARRAGADVAQPVRRTQSDGPLRQLHRPGYLTQGMPPPASGLSGGRLPGAFGDPVPGAAVGGALAAAGEGM